MFSALKQSDNPLFSIVTVRECIVGYIEKIEDILPIYLLSERFLSKVENRLNVPFDAEFLQLYRINDFSLVDICMNKEGSNTINCVQYGKFLLDKGFKKYLDLAFNFAVNNELKELVFLIIKAGGRYIENVNSLYDDFERDLVNFRKEVRKRKSKDIIIKDIEDKISLDLNSNNLNGGICSFVSGISGCSLPFINPLQKQTSDNICIGRDDLTSLTTGINNTVIGHCSLISPITASNNTIIGSQSIRNKNSKNVSNITNIGSNNEILFDNIENSIIIGNGAYCTESNEFVLGSAIHPFKTFIEDGTKYLRVTVNGSRAAIPIRYLD